ncbi:MAG: lysophospholipid acyltransferase family protein [Candidatus Kapaibacteriota bacterium]
MIAQYLLLMLLRITGYLSAALPHVIRIQAGKGLGRLLMLLSSKRVAITKDNIIKAFPEEQSTFHDKVLKGSYQNLGIVLLEISAMHFMSNQMIASYMSFENISLIEHILQRGKGIVIISGHLANWEYLAFTAGIHARKSFLLVAKEQKNPFVHAAITELRTRGGNTTVSMEHAAKPLVKSLLHNEPIALLIDQAADPQKDARIPFFGRDAIVFESPAALALRFQTPLVFAVPVRNNDGKYIVTLTEIPIEDLNNTPEDIKILTKRHTAFLESAIRNHPDQWTWQHNRWKYHA